MAQTNEHTSQQLARAEHFIEQGLKDNMVMLIQQSQGFSATQPQNKGRSFIGYGGRFVIWVNEIEDTKEFFRALEKVKLFKTERDSVNASPYLLK